MAVKIAFELNGEKIATEVQPNLLLVDFLRQNQRLTGTHVGCDTAQCGACTVHLNSRAVKSCAVLAVQADGARVTTIEGLAKDGALHPMQRAFHAHHGLQCGYCTPGMVMAAVSIAENHGTPDAATIRSELEGNLCRCTGYHNIVKAIEAGARDMAGRS
jgi:carbon-monoxide dehydrogenase small subunit